MSDALVLTAIGLAFAAIIVVRVIRGRRVRDAAAPVGAAASVLRDVYSGRGTDEQHAPEFDAAPSTSMTLDGEDPLRSHGVDLPDTTHRD